MVQSGHGQQDGADIVFFQDGFKVRRARYLDAGDAGAMQLNVVVQKDHWQVFGTQAQCIGELDTGTSCTIDRHAHALRSAPVAEEKAACREAADEQVNDQQGGKDQVERHEKMQIGQCQAQQCHDKHRQDRPSRDRQDNLVVDVSDNGTVQPHADEDRDRDDGRCHD